MAMKGLSLIGSLIDDMKEPEQSPDEMLAGITKRDYDRYIEKFRPLEEALLEARDSTVLIDRAREDAATRERIAKETAQRNIDRYGGAGLSAVQRQEQGRTLQRGATLAKADTINNARITQREVNQAVMADLINIGQGVNRNALNMMMDSAQMASNRHQAYKNARSSYSAQMTQLGGQVGSALLTAFLI